MVHIGVLVRKRLLTEGCVIVKHKNDVLVGFISSYALVKTFMNSDVAESIALPPCHFPSTKDSTLVVKRRLTDL